MKKLFTAIICTVLLLSAGPVRAATSDTGTDTAVPVAPDSASPADTIEAAAHRGDINAQYTLGTFYMHGHHKPQNHELAEKWLKTAAESGQKDALGKLGLLYAAIPFSNYPEACFWLTLAAHEGDAASAALLDKIRGHLTEKEKAALDERLVAWISTNKTEPAQ